MAENSAVEHHRCSALSEANHEPGRQTISTVIRIADAIMRPLTKRDWRHQGGFTDRRVMFVPSRTPIRWLLAVSGVLRAVAGFVAKA